MKRSFCGGENAFEHIAHLMRTNKYSCNGRPFAVPESQRKYVEQVKWSESTQPTIVFWNIGTYYNGTWIYQYLQTQLVKSPNLLYTICCIKRTLLSQNAFLIGNKKYCTHISNVEHTFSEITIWIFTIPGNGVFPLPSSVWVLAYYWFLSYRYPLNAFTMNACMYVWMYESLKSFTQNRTFIRLLLIYITITK